MSIDCPGHSGPSEDEGIIIDEVIIGAEENFWLALENDDFEALASLMMSFPQEALKFYQQASADRNDLAESLTPYFTRTEHYALEDRDIHIRLELAAIKPRITASFEQAIEKIMTKAEGQFDAMLAPKP